MRRAADVGRRGGHPRRDHDRRLPRLHPGHRHPHDRRRRRHDRRRRRSRTAVCGTPGRRCCPRSCLLRQRRRAPHCHRRPARAGPTASRQVGRRHLGPRHRRRPRGDRGPRGRAARDDHRGGRRRDRGSRRAASAQRHRAHLDRTGPFTPAVHDGCRGRRRPDARRLGCCGSRLRACLCAPGRRCAVRHRDAPRRRAPGLHPLPDGLTRRAGHRGDRGWAGRTSSGRTRRHGRRGLC